MAGSVASSSFIAKSNKASTFCPSPESARRKEFDAFACFTGTTRCGFTSHLVKGLKLSGVKTFTDELLPRGEALSDALTGHIKASRSTIVVVSKDFAESSWCLDEVVESFRCNEEKLLHGGHPIFPIFYNVDPSEIRHLRGKTAHYLAQHEERYGTNSDRVAWWRTCLVLLSNIAGWHYTSRSGRNESDLIEIIVKEVVKTLRMKNTALL